MVNCNYSEKEILERFNEVSRMVTDDCTMAGVELLACEILGVSQDRLYELASEIEE